VAEEYAAPGLRDWTSTEPTWGLWHVAEAQAGVLPAALAGRDSIELGCGTGYVSAWLARRGARPVGLDNSAAQLATARQLQDRFGLRFPLIHASAEQAPFDDGSFDLAISEYGASICGEHEQDRVHQEDQLAGAQQPGRLGDSSVGIAPGWRLRKPERRPMSRNRRPGLAPGHR
jgi:SAM-dependent methyltransferase